MDFLPDPSALALSPLGRRRLHPRPGSDSVFGFLDRASAACGPVLAVLLALPVILSYLVVVNLALAVRAAAAAVGQRAAAAVLGRLADHVARLAVPALLFGALLSFACVLFLLRSG